MNKLLTDALIRDFPELFRHRTENPNYPIFLFGIECKDGWEPMIRFLCTQLLLEVKSQKDKTDRIESMVQETNRQSWNPHMIQEYTPKNLSKNKRRYAQMLQQLPMVVQIKEKFGGLRFYVDGGTSKHHAIIQYTEHLSYHVCEECGTTKDATIRYGSYIRTLCNDHSRH